MAADALRIDLRDGEVGIVGTREGLVALAEQILAVAKASKNGAHDHIRDLGAPLSIHLVVDGGSDR